MRYPYLYSASFLRVIVLNNNAEIMTVILR